MAAVAVSLGAAGAADAAGTAAATAAAAATGVTGAGDAVRATERLVVASVGFVDRRNGVTALGLSAPSAWRLGLGATAAIAPEANDQREVEMRAESNSGQPPLATHSFAEVRVVTDAYRARRFDHDPARHVTVLPPLHTT